MVKSFIMIVSLVGALTIAILDTNYRKEFIVLATGAVCGFFGAEVPSENKDKRIETRDRE